MAQTENSTRVLFVSGRLDRGGAERHLSMLLPDLRAQGIDAQLFVLDRGGELEAETVAAGVPVSGVVAGPGGTKHLIAAAWALFRQLRRTRPDVVHFFLPRPYLLGSLVAIAAGSRARFMSRRSLANYHGHHPWLARLERRMHRGTSVLLGNSRAVVDQLVAESSRPSCVGLIHNGVVMPALRDDSQQLAARRSLGLPDNVFVIAIVANLLGYKGHADLLTALGLIADRLPEPWRLLVIGRDEGLGDGLKAQAAQLGLEDHVVWLGERQDARALWIAAEVGVLASHQEGFSNALIEGMAAGVPMVATAVGGNLDAIVDGQSGRLVGVSDPPAMADAILALARDAGLRQTMGRKARQRVETLFSQAACVERYVRLYRGMAELPHTSVQSLIDGAASR